MKLSASMSTLALSLLVIGCTSTPQPQQDLPNYLDQFIGQSEATLKSSLNFKQFGYLNNSKPVMTANKVLVYRIQRPLAIPMPTFTANTGGLHGSTASTNVSFSEGYNVYLNCDISFHFEQEKVSKWTYAGRAC